MVWEKLKNRFVIMGIVILVIGLSFIYRLVQLQLVHGQEYNEISEKKLFKSMPVKAPRGGIYDRYGRPLATNRMGFSVLLQKVEIEPEVLNDTLINLINLMEKNEFHYTDTFPISLPPFEFLFSEDQAERAEKEQAWKKEKKLDSTMTAQQIAQKYKEKYKISDKYSELEVRKIIGIRYDMDSRNFSITNPFTFATNVNWDVVAQLEERHMEFPGVNISTEPIRQYDNGELAAHILGRVGVIYEEEYNQLKNKGYGMNDILGKDGMEKVLEPYLKGKDGVDSIEQSVHGKLTQILNSKPPVPGNYAMLTIDAELQKVAEQSLKDTIQNIRVMGAKDPKKEGADADSGAVVAMDVNTGEILAMATYPTYDPARFNEDYAKLSKDPLKPMLNRAISGVYPPGSTFKMLTAVTALEEGIVTPYDTIRDEGIYRAYNDQRVCWIWNDYHTTHGLVNVSDAIKVSCNYYFYDVGRRAGIDKLNQYGKQYGLGDFTGIELSGEAKGILAGPESKKKSRNEQWYPGDTLSAAIGQHDNMFTPLQLASYVSTIVNGGQRYKTHLIKSVRSHVDGKIIDEIQPTIVSDVKMKQQNWKAIMEGMRSVTEDGTASNVFRDFPISVGGKTGTATVPKGSPNGVFVAFAPFDNPQIAVAVVVEHGGHGNYTAPVARDIFAKYLGLNNSNENALPVNSLIQ